MIELVRGYYAGERQTALLGIAIGAALVLIALLACRASAVGRGMAYGLLVAGLLQAAVSAGYIAVVGARASATVAAYANLADHAIVDAEEARVRETLRSGFTGALALDTALLIVGAILVFASQSAPTRKGVALALMIVGVAGHCIEALSMQKAQRYLAATSSSRPAPGQGWLRTAAAARGPFACPP